MYLVLLSPDSVYLHVHESVLPMLSPLFRAVLSLTCLTGKMQEFYRVTPSMILDTYENPHYLHMRIRLHIPQNEAETVTWDAGGNELE